MPILDPKLQYSLLEREQPFYEKSYTAFYFRYFRNASRNIRRNFSTLNTSIRFHEDLKTGFHSINKIFGSKFKEADIDNPIITDHYKFIYNHLDPTASINNKKGIKVEGDYFMQYGDSSTKFFQPNIYFQKHHSWSFSDTPIAILCINFEDFSYDKLYKEFFQLINIEIDLLSASGFTLVLCLNYSQKYFKYITKLIFNSQFSEIHFNFNTKPDIENFFTLFKENFQISDSLSSFIYLYTRFVEKKSENYKLYKSLKDKLHFKIIPFALDIKSTLEQVQFITTNPFPYCKTGFQYDKLRIRLSNVPLYEHQKDEDGFIPIKISGLTSCYISSSDFLSCESNQRVEIIFEDEEENHSSIKYVNFEDIHKIRKDMYIKDTFLLQNMKENVIQLINDLENEIKLKIDKEKDKKFKKKKLLRIFDDKFLKKSIKYATYAYAYSKSSEGPFHVHRLQLFAIYEAIKQFYTPSFNDKSKGIIYQVQTGEGKSCIISIIAAILALTKKTVHIVSSNINLANRDYMKSFDYFNTLGIKSAVLLHKNELPYVSKKKKSNQVNDNNNNNNSNSNKGKNNNSNINNGNNNNNDNNNSNNENSDINDQFNEYYQTYTQNNDNNNQYMKYYKGKDIHYYDDVYFKNSSKMNFSVCGIKFNNTTPEDKPNVIFSTIANFECFYLKMLEVCPCYISKYFKECTLIIDEADSILIDELTNGTIVSKEMKSNAKEILQIVYHNYMNKVSVEDTFNEIKDKCHDLQKKDVERMYQEIELVHQEDFTKGKRYWIEEYEVKNEKRKNKIFKNVLNLGGKILKKTVKGFIKKLTSKDEEEEEEEDDDDDDDDDDEEEEEDEDDSPVTKFNHIVPFDNEHKGILEPNKEFNGFIQQFIAIKEAEENKVENMVIKNISMSYLYISHPIFVKLYGKICGFTGTIGTDKDREIYEEQYNLKTKKITRNEPNQRVEFPIILCNDDADRNEKIMTEVIEFNRRGNPVLVIFQNLNEIEEFIYLLYSRGIKYFNVFNGKNENITPEKIAGKESSISLGTNFCGRGTNIIAEGKPLHVIISYFSTNSRVIDQAHGRTARQGQKGTSQIICTKNQFLYPSLTIYLENGIESVIEEFKIKDKFQAEYINEFKHKKPFIFTHRIKKQSLKLDEVKTMREARINVNRIVAYNYEFPLKMTIDTFLKIQSQKIFSIVNCPNSEYSWTLFQRYARELVFESWSLMVNQFDDDFFYRPENNEYKEKLEELKQLSFDEKSQHYKNKKEELNTMFSDTFKRYITEFKQAKQNLLDLIDKFLPFSIRNIVPSFIHIFKKVRKDYENAILESFNEMPQAYWTYSIKDVLSCQIGFKPYSLLTESGAKINFKNFKKLNYIKDPELKYLKKTPTNKICLLSITQKVDDIYDRIFREINKMLGEKTMLKIFMRRTLFGCEFGICFDFNFESSLINEPYCLIDKDPLLAFTICVKSILPILAGILIIFLVYLASLVRKIASCISGTPPSEIIKKGLFIFCDACIGEISSFALGKFISFLQEILKKQLEKIKIYNPKAAEIIGKLNQIFESKTGEELTVKFADFLGKKIKIKSKITDNIDKKQIMHISILLLFCFATFLMNFNQKLLALWNARKDSKEYNKIFNDKDENTGNVDQKIDDLSEKNEKAVQEEEGEILNDDLTDKDKKKIQQVNSFSKTFLYNFKLYNPLDMMVKFTEFVDDHDEVISDTFKFAKDIKYCIQNKGLIKKRCARFEYNGFRKVLLQQVRIYATNKCPSVLNMVGYTIRKGKQYLYVENKGNGTLEDLIHNFNFIKLNQTNKLIIAYGVACALESLHKNNIIHRDVKPSNISLDSYFHPYLSNFNYAVQLDTNFPYFLTESTPGFMAPEFILNPKSNQNSFQLDVYSYGFILFILITQQNPFDGLSESQIKSDTVNGKRPDFPPIGITEEWKNLVFQCWNQDKLKRPSFTEICNIIEKYAINQIKMNYSSTDSFDLTLFNKYKSKFNRNENKK